MASRKWSGYWCVSRAWQDIEVCPSVRLTTSSAEQIIKYYVLRVFLKLLITRALLSRPSPFASLIPHPSYVYKFKLVVKYFITSFMVHAYLSHILFVLVGFTALMVNHTSGGSSYYSASYFLKMISYWYAHQAVFQNKKYEVTGSTWKCCGSP